MNESPHMMFTDGSADLATQRFARLRSVMRADDVPWILTADPINIFYATGLRNMTVFSMMGASRFLLLAADGPVTMWEFAGSEHLADGLATIDEVRTAPGVTALSGASYAQACKDFAKELASLCGASRQRHLRVHAEPMYQAAH